MKIEVDSIFAPEGMEDVPRRLRKSSYQEAIEGVYKEKEKYLLPLAAIKSRKQEFTYWNMNSFPFCGVYFLFIGDELAYIGKSNNIPYRLKKHWNEKEFSHVATIEIDEELYTELENYYLRTMKAPLNVSNARGYSLDECIDTWANEGRETFIANRNARKAIKQNHKPRPKLCLK